MLLAVAVLLLACALWLGWRLRASLPQLTGERAVAGLRAPVEIERDARGLPTVRAANRLDAAAALGFLHGQERFFQMDLQRRTAAGELAELLGSRLVPVDRDHRLHRFRAVAEGSLLRAGPQERALVAAYTRGVNAGLTSLGDVPPEYLLLRAAPSPWRPADCYLTVLAMFFTLNDSHASRQARLGELQARLARPLFEFLEPVGTELDAPLIGPAFATPPIPGPEVLDLRRPRALPRAAAVHHLAEADLVARAAGTPRGAEPRRLPGAATAAADFGEGAAALLAASAGADSDPLGLAGSNNWAVSGAHTADGRALLANDMHLGLSVPNIWYWAALRWPGPDGAERQITGVTLPGTPGVAVGSNGHVAWGLTNSYGDFADLIDLESDASDPDVYRTPSGLRHLIHRHERIRVHGGQDEELEVLETIWGPVIDPGDTGSPGPPRPRRALAWTAHDPEAVNLGLFALEEARTLDQAIEIAHAAGIPPQNLIAADERGRIGWTIIGKVPRRVGFDGRTPSSWAAGSHRWEGWLTSAEVPRLLDPPSGRIWTANARTVDGPQLARLGDAGYDLGARARQIRDDLMRLERATARDMLAIQLDDRAVLLERWRRLLLATLKPAAVRDDPRRDALQRLVALAWTGHAGTGSAAYRAVREFRGTFEQQVFASLSGLGPGADGALSVRPSKQFEGPLWRLVEERPPHLLAPPYRSWDEPLLAAADALLASYGSTSPGTAGKPAAPGELARHPWGERNTVTIRHPLSRAVPLLGRWLDMPARPLPGDRDMPRVQGPTFGASERLVVSPGHEEQGFFHMPAGESGHPLSPHYRDGESAWERGEPMPFLPGPATTRLRLLPLGRQP